MSFAAEILKLVHELDAARPFQAEPVAKILKLPLSPQPDPPGGYFAMYKGHDEAHPLVKKAELRVPRRDKATVYDGILILDLAPKGCASEAEVQAEFGKDFEPSFPSPHAPPDAPTYIVYRKEWGAMRFGFQPDGKRCLVTVVLDATKRGG